ncbi:hypothetical protein P9G44_18290 [Bacillus paralicheniformis]|uniref:hypothetical protein n=1 Tax=Bacillus subtilis group TaxID=653685 RepID=UPI00237CAB4C|nr:MULTISPECIES: hypothetical protein [Bacillus subtilis group]MDE1436938.1 hypothetical protein [Bacillus licheniformis]MEC2212630.1 hypothetical protein [Bacillus paralicheniformis]
MAMHLNVVKGDFVIAEWDDEDWKEFRKTTHNLRMQGYRKIGQESDYLNYYEHYRKKGKKKVVTVTMLCM